MSSFVVVASRDHIQTAREGGFIQAGHGKKTPLQRLSAGDYIVCYSPQQVYGEPEKCQRFTAMGTVVDDRVYQVQMNEDFAPYRVDVAFENCREIDVRPLLSDLRFVENEDSWGVYVRRGLFEIPDRDAHLIRRRMDCGSADANP